MNQEKTANSLLKIRKVVREYTLPRRQLFTSPERFRALDGVSLTVNPGETFGIVFVKMGFASRYKDLGLPGILNITPN